MRIVSPRRGGLFATITIVTTMIVAALLTAAAAPIVLLIVSLFTAGVVLASAMLHRLRRTSGDTRSSAPNWFIDEGDSLEAVSVESTRPFAGAAPPSPSYVPLHAYLEHRYASNVVLTFDQIESLLGFSLPASARTEPEWWTSEVGPSDGHTNTWTAAGRTATPNLLARNVAFIRP